jgi:endonuclease YncB( thermonuclease family)
MRAFIFILIAFATSSCWAAEATITDADTLILKGTTYRLDGIDTPETDQVCLDATGATWACGIEARERLTKFINARDVRCDDKGADTVYHNRRIGICWVEGETVSLNQWLVLEGWALNFEPYAKGRFKADQDAARDRGQGLWKGCFISPQVLRRWSKSTAKLLGESCPKGNDWKARDVLFPNHPSMPVGCPIKGKLAVRAHFTGHRGIYHTVDCGSYRRTKTPDRWFCSEREAQAEGFRKSLTCKGKA